MVVSSLPAERRVRVCLVYYNLRHVQSTERACSGGRKLYTQHAHAAALLYAAAHSIYAARTCVRACQRIISAHYYYYYCTRRAPGCARHNTTTTHPLYIR